MLLMMAAANPRRYLLVRSMSSSRSTSMFESRTLVVITWSCHVLNTRSHSGLWYRSRCRVRNLGSTCHGVCSGSCSRGI